MKQLLLVCCAFVAMSLFALWDANAGDTWPQFRGPTGQGHSDALGLPLTWSETENITWKVPIEGKGWSSPVVAEGKIWLTTAIETPISEEEREKRLAGDPFAKNLALAGHLSLRVLCLDSRSGKLLLDQELFSWDNPDPIHLTNSYASPTAIWEAGRLFCHFGNYGTACIETASGNVLWKTRLPLRHNVGPGSSPVLAGKILFLNCDGVDQQYVIALDKQTGAEVWKRNRPPMEGTNGDLHKAFSTPLVIDVNGQEQIISTGAHRVIAYEPLRGEMLWQVDYGKGFSNVPRPVFGNGLVYICTGFMDHQLWAIRPEAAAGNVSETHVVWKQNKQIPAQSSPLLVGQEIYTISGKGILTCFDALTGETVWRERMPGNYVASPTFAEGRLYIDSLAGVTTVLSPGRKFSRLATNELEGRVQASPALVEHAIILRTETHLYRIEKNTNRAASKNRRE